MEAVIDKVISEIHALNDMPSSDGGFADIMQLNAIYFGDPWVIPDQLYPCVTVSAAPDDPVGETTGYDKRELNIRVSVLIDARQYFNATVDEATGDRDLVRVTTQIARWFRRRSKRTLDGTVINTVVGKIDYREQERGPEVAAKASQINMTFEKAYERVLD